MCRIRLMFFHFATCAHFVAQITEHNLILTLLKMELEICSELATGFTALTLVPFARRHGFIAFVASFLTRRSAAMQKKE